MASHLLDAALQERLCARLREVLDYSCTGNAYFRRKYAALSGMPLTLEDLRDVPVLRREEVQAAYPFGLVCRDPSTIPTYFETSGSTGAPLAVFPEVDGAREAQLAAYFDHWMGLRTGRIGRALVALPYEMNPMGLKFHRVMEQLGVTVIPVSVRSCLSPPAKVLALIEQLRPGLLVGRPLEAMRYAEGMRMLGRSPEDCSLRKIFLTGETMSAAKFRRIAEDFGGAEIYSTYGLTELDVGLTTCAHHRYHLPQSESLVVEVLADDGSWVREDEEGAVVITSLRKSIVPYIRYRTGDVARYRTQCGCGAPTPYLQLRGREVDAQVLGGRRIFPVDVEEILLADERFGSEYQLLIDEEGLNVLVEAATGRELDAGCADDLQTAILRRLGVRATVEVRPHNSIADKFGIAKTKGCRFVDLRGCDDLERERLRRINVCDGEDLR